MKMKLSLNTIRAGEERAYALFVERIRGGESGWILKEDAMKYRGKGRVMVRKVFAVARHVEGAKLSEYLAERGVDIVSVSSIRTALHRLSNALIKIAQTKAPRGEAPDDMLGGNHAELGRTSSSGGSLARYIYRNDHASS